jgi:hypothetical protein
MLGQGDRMEVGAASGWRDGLVRESAWLGVWWKGVCREGVRVSKLRMGLWSGERRSGVEGRVGGC